MDKCLHCQMVRNIRKRGLCSACYLTPEIRSQHPRLRKFVQPDAAAAEVTEEEINAIIEEQRAKLPKWWKKSTPPQDEPEPLTIPFLQTKLPRRTKSSERLHAYVSRSW